MSSGKKSQSQRLIQIFHPSAKLFAPHMRIHENDAPGDPAYFTTTIYRHCCNVCTTALVVEGYLEVALGLLPTVNGA